MTRSRMMQALALGLAAWVCAAAIAGAVRACRVRLHPRPGAADPRAAFLEIERLRDRVQDTDGGLPDTIGFIGDTEDVRRRGEIMRTHFVFLPCAVRPNAPSEWRLSSSEDVEDYRRSHADDVRVIDRGSVLTLLRRKSP